MTVNNVIWRISKINTTEERHLKGSCSVLDGMDRIKAVEQAAVTNRRLLKTGVLKNFLGREFLPVHFNQ